MSDLKLQFKQALKVLTPKRQAFVLEYLKDLCAKQAIIRAGYKNKHPDVRGSQILTDLKVQRAIELGAKIKQDEAGIETRRVVEELARIALSDPRKLFDEKGNLLKPQDLDDDTARAVASYEVTETDLGEGGVKTTRKVKLWDKPKGLDILAKHLGMYQEHQQTNIEIHRSVVVRVEQPERLRMPLDLLDGPVQEPKTPPNPRLNGH